MKLRESRTVLGVLMLAAAASLPSPAAAQAYPAKPVRLILPYLGGTEFVGRLLAAKMSPGLGQQVVVDPRPGAGGNIGHEAVAKAPPDGYTLMLAATAFIFNPILNSKAGYDIGRDYTYVALAGTLPNVLAVHPSVPVKSLRELVQLARANPGKVSYGSGPTGQTSHLAGEMFKALAKVNILMVPYKGAVFAMTGAMGGEVDFVIPAASAVVSHYKSGRMRVLAALDPKRLAAMPDIPTSAEAGMPQLLIANWYAILGPAGLPKPIVDRLNAEAMKVMQSAETREQFVNLGGEPTTGTPEQTAAYVRSDHDRWAKVIKDAGIKGE
jgi:tripartite-type tricarboxylate transporter receptor subunit TctC